MFQQVEEMYRMKLWQQEQQVGKLEISRSFHWIDNFMRSISNQMLILAEKLNAEKFFNNWRQTNRITKTF